MNRIDMCAGARCRATALVAGLLFGITAVATAETDGVPVNPYADLLPAEFLELPALDERIDFENPDYPLLQMAVLHLTNIERRERGREPVLYHPVLEAAAHEHSAAMRDHDFYSHTSPVQGRRTVQDRVAAAGLDMSYVGENIAIAPGIDYEPGRGVYSPPQNGGYFSYEHQGEPIPPRTYRSAAQLVVDIWMKSPGHRRNILRSGYARLGVGAAYFPDESFYGMEKFYFTQNFSGPVPR